MTESEYERILARKQRMDNRFRFFLVCGFLGYLMIGDPKYGVVDPLAKSKLPVIPRPARTPTTPESPRIPLIRHHAAVLPDRRYRPPKPQRTWQPR